MERWRIRLRTVVDLAGEPPPRKQFGKRHEVGVCVDLVRYQRRAGDLRRLGDDVDVALRIPTLGRYGAKQKPMCGRREGHVWTPPPVQEESLDSCGAGSGAAMCPASAAAAHRPRARMGV